MLARRLRQFCSWRLLPALTLVIAAAVVFGPHLWAGYHLAAARSDLAAYRPEAAREHLDRCLAVWRGSAAAHLLASRAARQVGDLKAADEHLRACPQSEEVAFEWALLQAADGNVREVEEFLQRRADQNPALAPLVWEAVASGYIRLFRMLDALACIDLWLRLDPDNLRAHELRGLAFHTGKQSRRAAEEFRRVLELDASRDDARERLAWNLLDMGSYDEALTHLELLAAKKPEDPDLRVRMARCHNVLGRPEEARRMLDAVLDVHPAHWVALRTRGQFALADRQSGAAERWLRTAAELQPDDYQTQWLLYQSLQQQNRTDEAKAQMQRAEAVKERAERLGELMGRKLFEQPLDPALHCEMGLLLLREGNVAAGEGWLLSALSLAPDHRPAHKALAELYERRGDAKRAEEHRARAGP